MIHKSNENIIKNIEQTNKEEEAILNIKGFYLLDILFNDPPYYIQKRGGEIIKATSGEKGFLGHIFKINNKNYCVGENGIYHLEDKALFTIDSLSFPIEEDVIVTYHASFSRLTPTSAGEKENIELNKPYNSNKILAPKQIWKQISLGETINIDNKFFQIEADKGSIFEIDGKNFLIEDTEYLDYQSKANTIIYKEGKPSIDVNIIYYDKEED